MATEYTTLEAAGREMRISSPSKIYFPRTDRHRAFTKLDLAEYYLRVADATVNHLRERPTTLKRWRDGITGDFFFQKRVPEKRPEWLQTATVSFPSGRSATELVPNDAAHLLWAVNLSNIDWNPWPVRRADLDHPDELRIDLDPTPGVHVGRRPQGRARRQRPADRDGPARLPEDVGLARDPRQRADRARVDVHRGPPRRARARAGDRAADARQGDEQVVEGGAPGRVPRLQPERARPHGRERLLGAPGAGGARVDALRWDEVADVDPLELRMDTVPDRIEQHGDPAADIDDYAGHLDSLLDLARRDEEGGLGDAPWPPNFAKQPGEPKRVQPSRAKKDG